MPNLNVVVCMKVVPKPEEIRVDPETARLERADARSEMNPPDMNALEMALGLKDRYGGQINILSMGPPFFEPILRTCLAMGADHIYLLSDPDFGGADTLATTYTLAKGIRKIGKVDLIFCGEESSDGATGQVPPGIAEWLDINQITLVTDIDFDSKRQLIIARREVAGGHELLEGILPAVLSVKTASNEPRFIDYSIKDWAYGEDTITVWDSTTMRTAAGKIGIPGSPTIVSGLEEAASRERKQQFISGSVNQMAEEMAEVIRNSL